MHINDNAKIENVDNVIEKGIAYLLSLHKNGYWKGFPTLAGESDVWVTGFILTHIEHLVQDDRIIKESQKFLLDSRHPSGGWSYSFHVPPDADSTSWCLMALESYAGLTATQLEESKSFLWGNITDNGVSTYGKVSGIGDFIKVPDDMLLAGWTSAHPDVSLAAVLADTQSELVPQILKWVSGRQTGSGLFNSYWWRGGLYSTTLLLRALVRTNEVMTKENMRKIKTGLMSQQLVDGGFAVDSSGTADAFTTALALESLTHLTYLGLQNSNVKCIDALLQMQEEDGNWEGNQILRIPAPFVIDPEQVEAYDNPVGGGNSLIFDKDGLFATVMACHALDCWKKIK